MCCLKWYRQRGDGGITPEEAGVLLPLKTLFIANFHGLPLLIIRDRSFFGLIKNCFFISNPKYRFVPRKLSVFKQNWCEFFGGLPHFYQSITTW